MVHILRNFNTKDQLFMKNPRKLMMVLALMFLIIGRAIAQQPAKSDQDTKKAEVVNLVKGGRYTFVATNILLPKGSHDTLSTGYVLDISRDTMIAHLPQLAQQRVMISGADSSGNQYTFTHFGYRAGAGKNGSWLVTIVPRQVQITALGTIRQIELNIKPLGYAILTVTGSRHSPVSYYGYIKPHSADFLPVSSGQ